MGEQTVTFVCENVHDFEWTLTIYVFYMLFQICQCMMSASQCLSVWTSCLVPTFLYFFLLTVSGCRFPPSMFTINPSQFWAMPQDYSSSTEHYFRGATFHANTMRVDYYQNHINLHSVQTYIFECLQEYQSDYMTKKDENKFVIRRKLHGVVGSDVYACLQFIFRDTNVVQLKQSALSITRDMKTCHNTTMSLLDSPMVYYHHHDLYWNEDRNIHKIYKPCPLKGGYVVDWKNSTGHRMCKNHINPFKVENECVLGEGLWFRPLDEYTPACVLKRKYGFYQINGFSLNDHYRCLASWSVKGYTFMVLLQDNSLGFKKAPCMRYPTYHGGQFYLDVFVDGVCDVTKEITHSKDNFQLILRTHRVSTLCSDELPMCRRKYQRGRCQPQDVYAYIMCRETCNICQGSNPFPEVSFPEYLHGEWKKYLFHNEAETWLFTKTQLTISSLGTFLNMGRSYCEMQSDVFNEDQVEEYILLSMYENGCSARSSVLRVVRRGNIVVSYQLSSSELPAVAIKPEGSRWVVDSNPAAWCQYVGYIQDAPPLNDKHRKHSDGWFNLIKNMNENHRKTKIPITRCEIPLFELSTFHARLETVNCTGLLRTTSAGIMQAEFNLCTDDRYSYTQNTDDSPFLHFKYHISCLSTFEGARNKTFLIAMSMSLYPYTENNTFTCWILDLITNQVQIYPPGICDSNTGSDFTHYTLYKKPIISLSLTALDNSMSSIMISKTFLILIVLFLLIL